MEVHRLNYKEGPEAVLFDGRNGQAIQELWAAEGGIEWRDDTELWVRGQKVPPGHWVVRHPYGRLDFCAPTDFDTLYEKALLDHHLTQLYWAAVAFRDRARESHYLRGAMDRLFRAVMDAERGKK